MLFGAGASYGSDSIIPHSPPLGGQLFGRLRERYPTTWGSLPEPYPERFETDFERAMQEVMESGKHWIGPLMQTMGLFFCSFRPDGRRIDLYSQLIDRMSLGAFRTTLFSALNYECLLEIAASQAGLAVNYDVRGHLPAQSIRVWKLHGSCNFIPNPNEVSMRRSASYAWGMTLNVGLLTVDPHTAAQWINGDNALYPAMCMFTLNKPSQIAPAVFGEYQTAWGKQVRQAESVLLVGVRPHAPDAHIWDPVEATDAHVYFVGSRQAFAAWRKKRKVRQTTFLGERFGAAIGSLVEVVES